MARWRDWSQASLGSNPTSAVGKRLALDSNGHNQQLTLDMEWPSPLGWALPCMLSQRFLVGQDHGRLALDLG